MPNPAGISIAGFGIACIDYIVVAPTAEPGGYSAVHDFVIQGGGLTGTAAVACARLGARAKMLGRVGDDEIGDQIIRGLQDERVDTSGLIHVPGGRSLFSVVMVDSRTAERTIYCRRDQNIDCATDLIPLDSIDDANVLLLDAHWPEGAMAAARRAKSRGIPIVCDIRINPGTHDLLALCDYPVIARPSALKLAPSGDFHEALAAIRSFGSSAAVITCGEDGAYYSGDEGQGHVEAFRVDAVDTTGAGDVFHGAFAVGLAMGWGLRDTVTFASAVSAIKCTQVGGRAGTPSYQQVTDFLASRGAALPG